MLHKLEIDKQIQAVQLYSSKKSEWEDKTLSVSAMFTASRNGKVTGYDIYFKGADKKFFYKEENVRILHKVRDIDIEKHDVYADGVKVNATKLELFEKGFFRYTEKRTFFTQKAGICYPSLLYYKDLQSDKYIN